MRAVGQGDSRAAVGSDSTLGGGRAGRGQRGQARTGRRAVARGCQARRAPRPREGQGSAKGAQGPGPPCVQPFGPLAMTVSRLWDTGWPWERTARTHAQCAEPQACHDQEAQWSCGGTPPPQGRPSTCPVFRPEPSVGRLGHPCLSPGNLVCPEPGSVAQDEEAGAGAWRLSGVDRRPSCRRGGKNGVRVSPGRPSAGEKGRPCSFPDKASLPSFQAIRGGIPALASLSVFPPVSTLLGGLVGGEGQVPSGEELPLVFFCLFHLNFPL